MIVREKKIVVSAIFILALLTTGFDGLQADKLIPKQENKQTPNLDKALPNPFRLLPDIEVKVAGFERVSTELGMPGIEFPQDKLRLKYVLKNSGLAPCPEGGSYHIQVKRNGESLVNSSYTNLLGGAGTDYKYSFIDTIVHGQAKELNYKITVTPNFREVSDGNNSRDSMLNEPMIHGSGSVDYAVTEFTSSFVDGPAGRTFYFVVTVKNNSLFYPSSAAGADIYIKKNDEPITIASFYIGSSGTRLPGPTEHTTYTIGRKASELPAGNYWVKAVLDIMHDYDPSLGNNTASQKNLIKNMR
jgi:hypothetical protein